MSREAKKRCKFPEERKKLLRIYKKDQFIRIHGDFNKPETVLEMARIDLKHQAQLVKILENIKLPSVKNIGYDGAEAVWLIAQHAAYNLALMKEALKLIQITTKTDPKGGYYRGIPYLVDRINIMEGKPQLHGTQFWANPSGIPEPYPIKDLKNIDKIRRQYNLGSFADYKKQIFKANSNLKKKKVLEILYC